MRLPLLLALLLLAGCDSATELTDGPNASTDPDGLTGEDGWTVSYVVSDGKRTDFPGLGSAVPEDRFTATFDDDRVNGNASLNSYGGTYHADADGAFQATDVVTTLIGVSDRNARRANVFFAELAQATRFSQSLHELRLTSPDGDGVVLETNGFRFDEL